MYDEVTCYHPCLEGSKTICECVCIFHTLIQHEFPSYIVLIAHDCRKLCVRDKRWCSNRSDYENVEKPVFGPSLISVDVAGAVQNTLWFRMSFTRRAHLYSAAENLAHFLKYMTECCVWHYYEYVNYPGVIQCFHPNRRVLDIIFVHW